MKKKIVYIGFVLIAIFKFNMIVNADTYCNYNTKTACENHNKYVGDKYDYYCEWKKTNGKEYCVTKCSSLGQQACAGYSAVCKWFSSNKKCYYFEEEQTTDITAPSASKVCSETTKKSDCKNSSNCRWDDNNNKCREACASLSKSNCNNTYCKWSDSENKCNEVCAKITDSSDCKLASCEWKNNKCSAKVVSNNNSNNNSTNNNSSTTNSEQENIDESVYDNYDDTEPVSCGKGLMTNIPQSIPNIVRLIYLVIQIAVPVLLVIFGILDLFKGLTAQKEDEIKKGQQVFVKRLIAAALIFFVFLIVKLLIGFAADASGSQIVQCVECFISKECD